MKTIPLYRPIGEKELILIIEDDFKKYPPRLDWQPIFYPVLNEEYASDIAGKWNTNDAFGNYLGFVTKFTITEEEFNKYKIENVGGTHHDELWVPSDQLESFNQSIIGKIEVIKVFIGSQFDNSSNKEVTKIINNLKQ